MIIVVGQHPISLKVWINFERIVLQLFKMFLIDSDNVLVDRRDVRIRNEHIQVDDFRHICFRLNPDCLFRIREPDDSTSVVLVNQVSAEKAVRISIDDAVWIFLE